MEERLLSQVPQVFDNLKSLLYLKQCSTDTSC